MSDAKIGAKVVMGICMATGFIAGFFTYTVAIPVQFFALITVLLTIIAVIVGSSGYTRGEDNGGLLGAGGGMAILGAIWLLLGLYTFQVVLIPFIILEIGAILFLCY
jgi:hypothetical protein